MSAGLWTIALTVTLGQVPAGTAYPPAANNYNYSMPAQGAYSQPHQPVQPQNFVPNVPQYNGYQPQYHYQPQYNDHQPQYVDGAEMPVETYVDEGYSGDLVGASTGQPQPLAGAGYGDQLYPFDAQFPWHHGYFQRIPAYGGYSKFRPYNWRHVMAQSQASAGWGMSPQMPYSQQFWHRYEEKAALKDYLRSPTSALPKPDVEEDADGGYGDNPNLNTFVPNSGNQAPYQPAGYPQQPRRRPSY